MKQGQTHRLDSYSALDYIVGKRALFTIKNETTGNRFTYRTKQSRDKKVLFISVLTGPNNESDYTYLGYINAKHVFNTSEKSSISTSAQSFQVFAWVYDRLRKNTLPDNIAIFHFGNCGMCGKTLTDDESIKRGIGPLCWKQLRKSPRN